jgi:hypothetical protein
MRTTIPLRRRSGLLFLGLPLLWACSESSDPLGPEPEEEPVVVTVDASTGWAYLSLTPAGPVPVTVTDASTSDRWDIAVFATSVMINGGDAGPGGAEGFCVCNGAMTEAEVLAATPEMGLERFRGVGASAVPATASSWISEELVPSFSDWWSYDPTTRSVSAVTGATWIVRTAEGNWARVRVVSITNPGRNHAGTVVLEYQLQMAAGGPLGALQSVSLDGSAGVVSVDLETGATGDLPGWDLRLDGYTMRVNGGASGPGRAGAVRVLQTFDQVTNPSGVPPSVLRGDSFGGVFNGPTEERWFRYNLQGNNQIWPTYHVYLIRRGDTIHRVQLVGYYGTDGTSRQVSVRSAPLDP